VKVDVPGWSMIRGDVLRRFGRLDDAEDALLIVRDHLPKNFVRWQGNLLVAEAQLYYAERDVESCCELAQDALDILEETQSVSTKAKIERLYVRLQKLHQLLVLYRTWEGVLPSGGCVMQLSTDVVIIGGGVVGCLIAYQLRKLGLRVIVLERGVVGGQASTAATGLLAPFKPLGKLEDSYLDLQRTSLALFPQLVEELEDLTDIQVEYRQTGTVRIVPEKQASRLEKWTREWQERGVEMNVLQGEALRQLEPALASEYQLAVAVPSEPQVRAAYFMQAVALAAKMRGVLLLEQCQVISIERECSRVVAVQTRDGTSVACGHVIIAAGAWSEKSRDAV